MWFEMWQRYHMEPTGRHIENPILPGFHPDPSIVRVGHDYYVATSTFEWFPGVRLHHSRDLVHWRPLGHALTRRSQLDMIGNPRSGGIWAPCLSYHDGRFYLVYSDVKAWGHGFVDSYNYLVTAERIEGPWSERIELNKSGFDPSLFHDEDGRKWLVNMVWDHRPGKNRFGGIVLQELDVEARKLIGEPRLIFSGTSLGCTEGPHLYRRDRRYYLLVAEGGTSWDHAVTLARASHIDGPYEADPEGPLLTSRHDPTLALQKAGHASLVQTPAGEWYLAHLCGRPVGPERRCILGRETALQAVRWTADGWLRLNGGEDGGVSPRLRVPAPALPSHAFASEAPRDDFDEPVLGPHYQTLRDLAHESWLSLDERPGYLRLRGRDSPQSLHRQSVLGRRVQALRCRFETCLEFQPNTFQQLAGLMAIYDDQNFYYARLSFDENIGPSLGLLASKNGKLEDVLAALPVAARRVHLRAEFDLDELRFWYSEDGVRFRELGGVLDATTLSDEHTSLGLGFTGAFVALAAHDVSGRGSYADFDYFEYRQS